METGVDGYDLYIYIHLHILYKCILKNIVTKEKKAKQAGDGSHHRVTAKLG